VILPFRVGRGARRAVGWAASIRRRLRIARSEPAPRGAPVVFYGYDRIPGADDYASGGIVKFQRLQGLFPNDGRRFNVLYVGSSSVPRDLRTLLRLARSRGAAIVWNQDGVAYPGWHGPGWERLNAPMAAALAAADHVFFQSEFCRTSSDRYLGNPVGTSEILYNAVDTAVFTPAARRSHRPLTLLLGGSQYQRYRVEIALETLAEVRRIRSEARLLIAGPITWSGDPAAGARWARAEAARHGIADAVELIGPFRQSDAPDVLRRADVLVHPKYNDPCPGAVIEAMSCGLPVAYSASGGVPELVGSDAGIGIPAPLDWERQHLPAPHALAEAVLRIAEGFADRAAAARERAVLHFDLEPWRARHTEIFERLAQ
jgi:glycosyltransferase involved in cell wall biosynthesis